MQEKRDTHSEKQLPLEFESVVATRDSLKGVANNVVRVQFGIQKNGPLGETSKDQALIERILQSAQKLKW